MAGYVLNVLVAGDHTERGRIASALQAKQLAVVAVEDHRAAIDVLNSRAVDLAVIAHPKCGEPGVSAALRAARRLRPALKALLIVEPDFDRPSDLDCDGIVVRPFDEARLASRICDLLLHEGRGVSAHAESVAEFGIGAARLACLNARQWAATAEGRHGLARDLVRQIETAAVLQRSLERLIAANGEMPSVPALMR